MTSEHRTTELLHNCGSPGAQYVLFDSAQLLVEINAGFTSLGPEMLVDSATTFNLYSITKTATATAVMQLAAKGQLKLSDDATAYFPQLSFSAPFTIEMLLRHRSGIRNPLPISFVHLVEDDASFKTQSFADRLISENTRLVDKPGLRFRYSNIGYLMLGRIIELVSGNTYKDYVLRHILGEHLRDGTLSFTISDNGRHASGHHKRILLSYPLLKLMLGRSFLKPVPGHRQIAAFRNHYVNGPAYGGLIGNVRGLAAYGQAQLRGDLLMEKAFSDVAERWLGWFRGGQGRHRYFYHPGGGGGYYAELRLYPDLGLGSAVAKNISGFSDLQLLDRLDAVFAANHLRRRPI
jgi:D-alanyl-D-alanine carboxypeptidase